MTPEIPTCPHCGAPLATSRFAATVVCAFCEAVVRIDPSSVSAGKYRRAWAEWNNPKSGEGERRFSMGDSHWTEQCLLARGEISDVYLAKRARWPSELVVLKVLRDHDDAPLFEREWDALGRLHASPIAPGMKFGLRVPMPVVRGPLENESGRLACAYRWAGGFMHTFEMVREAYPDGIPPVASIWILRRILEILFVLRSANLVHGAILPNHLIIQDNEHGVRLVGFSCADSPNAPLRAVSTRFEDFYPSAMLRQERLTKFADIVMTARCVRRLLLGRDGSMDRVPRPLQAFLERMNAAGDDTEVDPMALHKEAGELATTLFGPPSFHPITMT